MKVAHKDQVYFLPSIITLGVKSLDCKRYGICEVKVLKGFQYLANPFDRKSYAVLQVSKANLIGIHFLHISMSRSTLKKHFYNNMFTIEESYSFNVHIDGHEIESDIPEGEYSLLPKLDYLSIKLSETCNRFVYPSDLSELYLNDRVESLST